MCELQFCCAQAVVHEQHTRTNRAEPKVASPDSHPEHASHTEKWTYQSNEGVFTDFVWAVTDNHYNCYYPMQECASLYCFCISNGLWLHQIETSAD